MTKIENLIQRYCPDGVQFSPIWELTAWDKKFNAVDKHKQPVVMSYKYFLASDLKALASDQGEIKLLTTNKSDLWTTEELAKPHLSEAELIAIPWGGNPQVQYYKGKFLTADNRIAIAKNPELLSIKFLYYYLVANLDQIAKLYKGAGIKHPSMDILLDITVPVPPIEIQNEIVKILDKFSELEAELEAELVARKSQFDHFRDQLVSRLMGECDWVPFGSVATIVRGASPRPIEKYFSVDAGSVPWIKIGDTETGERYITNTAQRITLEGAKKSRKIEPGDFILSNSMSFGRPYISKIQGYIHDGWLAISDFRSSLIPEFLYYVLQSKHIQNEFDQKSNSGSVSNLNAEIVKSVLIPIPGLERQSKMVDMLSKMEDLVISQTIGLPAEINARRKQFDYYRDKLLTFKELESA